MNIWPEKYRGRLYREGEGGGEGGGDAVPEWVTQLPEEFHDVKMLHQYKDLPSAIKGFRDTKEAVSKGIRLPSEEAGPEELAEFRNKLMEHDLGLVAIPGPDASPEEMARFQEKLGVPSEVTDYEIPDVDGMKLSDDRMKFLRETAKEAGVTKKQFTQFMEKVLKADSSAVIADGEARARELTALKNEWGDAYDHKVVRATNFLENTNAPAPLKEALKANQLGPETLKWLDSLSQRTGEKGGAHHDPLKDENGEDVLTPEEARARADEILKKIDILVANGTRSGPEYDRLVQRRADYIKVANRG